MRKGKSSFASMNMLPQKVWSNYSFFFTFVIMQVVAEVKRRKEESSLSDALTPKKGKTRFASNMGTYSWACPLTPSP